MVEVDGKLRIPERISEITEYPLHLSEFEVPGKYRIDHRREFDLRFLRNVRGASVKLVEPLTSYNWTGSKQGGSARASDYFELRLDLEDYTMVIGNLPANLLAPQEDYSIEGFGVGVLKSGEVIERRQLLLERGHSPVSLIF